MSDRMKVLIADDHRSMRHMIRTVLQGVKTLEIVGEACDGEQAVQLALKLQPDVVLMDMSMPRLSGESATQQIMAALPRTRVVAFSASPEERKPSFLSAGAADVVTKGADTETLIGAIMNGSGSEETATTGSTRRAVPR